MLDPVDLREHPGLLPLRVLPWIPERTFERQGIYNIIYIQLNLIHELARSRSCGTGSVRVEIYTSSNIFLIRDLRT